MNYFRFFVIALVIPACGERFGSEPVRPKLAKATSALWSNGPTLQSARQGHTATLLADGRVLVVGGFDGSGPMRSAEIYDPSLGTWTFTGDLANGRYNHAATLVKEKVLVAGGMGDSDLLDSAEMWDPDSGTWSSVGTLREAKDLLTLTVTNDYTVYSIGGRRAALGCPSNPCYGSSSAVDFLVINETNWVEGPDLSVSRFAHATILEPTLGTIVVMGGRSGIGASAQASDSTETLSLSAPDVWNNSASMSSARAYFPATVIPNTLSVLVAGGSDSAALSQSEIYDITNDQWTTVGDLTNARVAPRMLSLPSGKILAIGGWDSGALDTTELFDPVGLNWSPTSTMTVERAFHTATTMLDGRILVCAGSDGASPLDSCEFYSGWEPTGPISVARSSHTATLLPSGQLLVTGGENGAIPLDSVELYDPTSHTWSNGRAMSIARTNHAAFLLNYSNKVLVVGGHAVSGEVSSAEIYDPTFDTWTPTGTMISPRERFGGAVLPSGRVLVAGGSFGTLPLSSAEVFNPTSGSWTATAPMASARRTPTVTLLPSGKVLVAGGGYPPTNAAELFDPTYGAFFPTGSMHFAREHHTASLLASGDVLVVGGKGWAGGYLDSAEVYHPGTGTWTDAGALLAARGHHAATVLPSGQVLVTGGMTGTPSWAYAIETAEVFQPSTGSWTQVDSMSVQRYRHTSTLLGDGSAIVVGGAALGTTEVEIWR